ncbi:hypothetical protein KIL84_004136, partial [Mauremys mutica]
DIKSTWESLDITEENHDWLNFSYMEWDFHQFSKQFKVFKESLVLNKVDMTLHKRRNVQRSSTCVVLDFWFDISEDERLSLENKSSSVTAEITGGKSTPCLAAVACPEGWVGYGGKCYYFSELEGNWSSSQSHCSSLGASLAGIDTLQENAFMLRYKGPPDHWIGLQREQDQPWKWPNGTEFNNLFEVRGGGDCAYLNEKAAVSSSRCYTRRNWICSKPDVTMKTNDNSAGRD